MTLVAGLAHHWPAGMWRALAPARAIGRAASGAGLGPEAGPVPWGGVWRETCLAAQLSSVDGSCARYGVERVGEVPGGGQGSGLRAEGRAERFPDRIP